MVKQGNAIEHPIDCDDLQRAQDDIQTAQTDIHDVLEQMIDTLHDGKIIDPKLYEQAEECIQELEAQANSLRKDLEKLQKQ